MVGGIDLVDGTPVLDIKPYVPFADSIPNSTAPDWVGREAARDEPLKIVRRRRRESEAPLSSSYARSRAAKTLYADVGLFIEFVREVLSFDIRSIRERNASAEKRKFEACRSGALRRRSRIHH